MIVKGKDGKVKERIMALDRAGLFYFYVLYIGNEANDCEVASIPSLAVHFGAPAKGE